MMKFRKGYDLRIIAITITSVLFLTDSLYSALSSVDTLRIPTDMEQVSERMDDLNVCVNEKGVIQTIKAKDEFQPSDYQAVEVCAFYLYDMLGKIALFRRASGLRQAGELLFQSGKISFHDIKGENIGKSLDSDVVYKAVTRELRQEMGLECGKDDVILLGEFNQQRADRKHWFRFYLTAVSITSIELERLAFDDSIDEFVIVDIKNNPQDVNPNADEVFQEMFKRLNLLNVWNESKTTEAVTIILPGHEPFEAKGV